MRSPATLFLALVVAACGASSSEKASTTPPTCPEGSSWTGTLCVRTTTEPATAAAPSSSTDARSTPPPSVADTQAARASFQRAVGFYAAADFTHALESFEAAYRAAPAPAVLYDIAITLEQLGRKREALSTLRDYKAKASPTGARAAEVDAKISALEKSLSP
ncbi:hypothetical protein BH09MYX1_BH09MYX1_53960 [soil metagenome]